MNTKLIEWVLRIAVSGSFFGHGVFALQGKEKWVQWMMNFGAYFGGWSQELATQLLFSVGVMDVLIAFIVLVKPVRGVLLWATVWAFWTAAMRPLPFIDEPIWDFIERFANWGAPLALLFVLGWPKTLRDWFR
ncbi:MAG: hypothetical protein HYT14_00685 [Candidatus Liptonbacteria bacterium]|nr:hypothetical protein [Candidatus Liptonbacteria bacterium]